MVYDIDGLKYALSTLESVDNYPLQITVKIAVWMQKWWLSLKED